MISQKIKTVRANRKWFNISNVIRTKERITGTALNKLNNIKIEERHL